MENQLCASKSPLSTDKRINLVSPAPESKINMKEPLISPMKNDNAPRFPATIQPMNKPNGNGKHKVIDLNTQRHEKEYDDRPITNGVKQFLPKYYKKNPDDGWTDEEHELFLMGLLKYGIGNYRKISKNYVRTKDPEQVEKHAGLLLITSGQMLKSSPRQGRKTTADVAMANPAAPSIARSSYLMVPYVADAASRTNGMIEAVTAKNLVVDQIIDTITRTRTLELFPTSPPPTRPTLIIFPVVAPAFTVLSETGNSNAPPNSAYESNYLQDMPTYGSTIGQDFFPSHGTDHQLNLELGLGSLY